MAHYDLLIRNGTVVDGTGADRMTADVAVGDGKIAALGSLPDAAADEEIDASGCIVIPGFVDVHTHYDGQVTWDPVLEPSASHGVTTIVTGNCGVGFAPVRPGNEDWLIQLMEGVEDIPARRSVRASTGPGRRSPNTSTTSTGGRGGWTSAVLSRTARSAPT